MQIAKPTFLEQLNPSQQEAVTHTTGPLLIIAGPGSGKTRTVVHSIAYAIEEYGVMPDRILTFSFTVKASEELRYRVAEAVGLERSSGVWISTFHRFCRQVLREDIEALGIGYTRDFKALEENDQRQVIQNQIDYLQYHSFARSDEVSNFIAKCKAMDIRPSESGNYAPDPDMSQIYVEIYERYENHLKDNGAIDYENQQLFTEKLFKNVPEVKVKWQEKFDLILVDEHQDTDPVQYRIIKALSEKHLNLRVVGDDDQGIYGFRGADIRNILNFEKDYPDAKVITLEQNYRSTQQIVKAASALADFNPHRREKELFTTNAEGDKVKRLHCADQKEESVTIAAFINRAIREDWRFGDFAILCRTNWQANAFKEAFTDLEIPFHVGEFIDPSKDAVSIMTIHKSKGLEFPNVFVAGVCKGLLPHQLANEKEWDEELRLLYVAMTRAKNWLCLSSYDTKSRFLQYIPPSLLESLHHTSIPSRPEERGGSTDTEEPSRYVEPPPIQSESDMTVLGVDPGVSNVGWAITQKTVDGYTVHKYDTERPTGSSNNKLMQIEHKINALTASYVPDAIAVEKLEGATDEWFLDVAGCVAMIRSVADRHNIECHLYTPQHVKDVATEGNRNASKLEVQRAVKKMCNLQEIPQPDHSADAIAVSLCFLRNHLNFSRFQGNARKQEHCKGGHILLDEGQYNAAVTEFKEAINIDPIFTEAHCSLGRAYLEQGNLEAAANAAKKVLGFEDNDYPPARELLRAIKQAHCDRGDTYFSQGKLKAAENSATEALRLESNDLSAHGILEQIKQAYYDQALTHLNNERYDEAIVQFKETINRYSNFIAAYCGLGQAYLGQGRLRAAENSATEALRLESNYPPAHELLNAIKQTHCDHGDAYLNQGKLGVAENSAKEALRLDSNYQSARELLEAIKQAYHDRALAHLNNEQYDDAIADYSKIIELNPNSAHSYSGRGAAYYFKNNYDCAIADYTKAIELNPIFEEAYCGLGWAYLNQGDHDYAIVNLTKAIELNPDFAQAYHRRAYTYYSMDDYARAIPDYTKAIELNPNLAHSYSGRGAAYAKIGNHAQKKEDYATAKLLESAS